MQPDHSGQNCLELRLTHIHFFHDTTVQHESRDVPAIEFVLRFTQAVEDGSLFASEAVSYIGDEILQHLSLLPRLVDLNVALHL